MKYGKGNDLMNKLTKISKLGISVTMAICLTLGGSFSFISKAGVPDESTYKSEVKGTDTTYYRTIATNYHAGNILGLVTLSTAAEIKEATRITEEEVGKGFEPVLYVNIFSWESNERVWAENLAKKFNGTVFTMVDLQLFRYEASYFNPVKETENEVKMILGIPDATAINGNEVKLYNKGYEFALIRVHEGTTEILRDLDKDEKTLTFTSDKFSAFALVYAPTGEIDKYLETLPGEEGANGGMNTSGTVPNSSGNESSNNNDELDEVPKTGDILWELESRCY